MPVYNYECPEHEVFASLQEYSERDEPQPCPHCEYPSPRTWKKFTVSSMQHSYRDGTKRFQDIKEINKLKLMASEARGRGDLATDKQIKKTIKEFKK